MARQRNARRNRYWDAALHRQEDAEALMSLAQGSRRQPSDRRRWAGAQYVAGIAVECLIKFVVCVRHDLMYVDEQFPELVTHRGHDLVYGLQCADLLRAIECSQVAPDWQIVRQWNVNWRYEPGDGDPEECRRFIVACQRVMSWLRYNVD
jgi:hypothetical protein